MIIPDTKEWTEGYGPPLHAWRDATTGAVRHFTGITYLDRTPKSLHADRWPHRAGCTPRGGATAEKGLPVTPLAPAACTTIIVVCP